MAQRFLYFNTAQLFIMAMTNQTTIQGPTDNEIAVYAYHLWEADGSIPGRDMDYWLQAKAHLIADREYEAGLLRTTEEKTSSTEKSGVSAPVTSNSKLSKKRRSVREPAYA